ncbi:hypothetical protein EPI10_028210 [Gossypium australe]|uniref:Uncharacterized protein n=1 Tax=Gossypium australe TaxID=47621 RepID=A0A5B6UZU7_9ROSI|nr:hypothetical protein EPI10_028210 [Gossypium australe]
MPNYTKKRKSDGMIRRFCHGNLNLDNKCCSIPGKNFHVYPHGAVEAKDGKTSFNFKVNGQRRFWPRLCNS